MILPSLTVADSIVPLYFGSCFMLILPSVVASLCNPNSSFKMCRIVNDGDKCRGGLCQLKILSIKPRVPF